MCRQHTHGAAAPDTYISTGADDYELRPLTEVEQHIKTNRHLPDVPSAEQMKQNGVDPAEMNMALLKKVEELTLYAIDQDKRLSELEAALTTREAD